MANVHRGEMRVVIAGKEHTMRVTFEAMANIEDLTGTRSIPLVSRFAARDVGVRDIVAVLGQGIRAAEPAFDPMVVREAIEAQGPVSFIDPCLRFLTLFMNGGQAGNGAAADGSATSTPSAA